MCIVLQVVADAPHPARFLMSLLRRHRRGLLIAAGFQALKDSPVWLVPVLTAQIIDAIVGRAELAVLGAGVALSVVVLLVNYPGHLLYVRFFSRVYRSVAVDVRNDLTARFQNLSIGYHARRSASLVQTKVVRDVENIEALIQQSGPVIGLSTSILIGSIVMTALQVPTFLIVFLVTVPIAVGLVAGMRSRSARRNEEFRLRTEDLAVRVGEMASLIPITRAHGLEDSATRRVGATADEVRRAGLELDRLNSRFETTSWVSFQVLSVACLGLAGVATLTGVIPISAGQVVLLGTYFATLTSALTQLIGLTPLIARGFESLTSVSEVLEEPDVEENHGRKEVAEVSGRITFEQVGFRFPDAEEPALDGIDLEFSPGETVAFVGASGSGKSTMLNLVLGFLRPTRGRILFDGVDMQELDMRSLRRFVSVVPQESVLFEGTIFENVGYGIEHPDHDAVREALVESHAAEFVDGLKLGGDTRVGPRGARLSGGQRQRLAIARALVRDPRILLLDEATSALDTTSEAAVQEALGRLRQGRTALVVAHRLSTIRSADRIVVLEEGRIVEIGAHADLVAADGAYARMVRIDGR